MKTTNKCDKSEYESVLKLMSIYREEWQYRDKAFMSSFFKFSTFSLVITFFPNLVGRIGISNDTPLLTEIPPYIFSILGIICALFGLFYSYSEAKRIVKLDKAYKRLMDLFPEDYKVDTISKKNIYSVRLNSVLCCTYIIPIVIAIINFITVYKK